MVTNQGDIGQERERCRWFQPKAGDTFFSVDLWVNWFAGRRGKFGWFA